MVGVAEVSAKYAISVRGEIGRLQYCIIDWHKGAVILESQPIYGTIRQALTAAETPLMLLQMNDKFLGSNGCDGGAAS